jgi:hypothetical protein
VARWATRAGQELTEHCNERQSRGSRRGGEAVSDWDFLHDMHNCGYSAEDIADAAACGYAPHEAKYLDREWVEAQLEGEPEEDAASEGVDEINNYRVIL